ncbi:MAG: DUF86 domain-containing protein [Clostridia bacterium]|nr:DUF86 domain-containing protein [Clostridia bacterium]
MDSRDVAILNKILHETSILSTFVSDCDRDTFLVDERTKRAVCMTLINIGEMVKLLSEQAKETDTTIPWRQAAGLRDVTAHGYQTLRMEDIWETVTTDIPLLQKQISKLLAT